MVTSWLLHSVDREIAESVLYCDTAEKMWNQLQVRYSQSNNGCSKPEAPLVLVKRSKGLYILNVDSVSHAQDLLGVSSSTFDSIAHVNNANNT
ncbi:hypothetical protein LIER_17649 [Lithospermum erythrorhizon]|uniref:Retrotransposon Copia-like N-terminal domain-containing protein n=1 Tax=Lithospermum erythrorhizon TaxID=34254 RepID=A0AAV3QEC8_LITER